MASVYVNPVYKQAASVSRKFGNSNNVIPFKGKSTAKVNLNLANLCPELRFIVEEIVEDSYL